MERKINVFLRKWKKDPVKKPLLIYGCKQVGKTYTALELGEKEYKNTAYFNTNNNIELFKLFKKEKNPERLISSLSLLCGESILSNDTLIIFDNISDIEIINGVKLLSAIADKYHIILITSLKENLSIFKCEEFQYKMMTNMDFEEFLIAKDNKQLIEFIKNSFKNNDNMPFHTLALDLYNEYMATGGMPEAVQLNVLGKSSLYSNCVFDKVVDSYKKEISGLDNLIDITRSIEVFDSIPFQLQKPNKKFQYGLIKTGGRSKDYNKSLDFLCKNGFCYRSYKISNIKLPISSCKDLESFKLYLNDTGLLYYLMYLNKNKFLLDNNIRNIIYENSIAINLINLGFNLYYYQSEGKAEVSFVVQTRTGKIIPIELVDKNVSKSKALTLLMKKFNITEAIRITEDNFSIKKGIKYIPIYALFCLDWNI